MSSALIQQGLAALRTGDAAAARRVFETALAEGESGQVLEGLGEALYLGREYVAAVAHYERAYVAYRRERQSMAAGRAARTVAWITGNVLGDWAVRSGWLARARALLEEAGVDRPEHGWVLIIKAFSEPDAQVRETQLREAIAVGRRFGDPDIEFLALAYLGSLYVMIDRVEEGLAFSDEALAALCAGELTELATIDEIFCGLFWSCELVNDVPRADQWIRAASERLRHSNVVAAFCRAHYGGILTAAGRWEEAETELLGAVDHFDHGMAGRGGRRDPAGQLAGAPGPSGGGRPSCSRAWASIPTPSLSWRGCNWPGVSWRRPRSCWSGPPPAPTMRCRRSGPRPWSGRCSGCWLTCSWRGGTWRRRSGPPGGWTGSPRPSGDHICGRWRRWPEGGSG